MKQWMTLIGIALAVFGLNNSAQAQMDLTTKPGIYLTGSKLSIDESKDKWVAKGATVHVFSHEASSFTNGYYVFNIGIIATRSGVISSYAQTYGLFSSQGGSVGREMKFGPGRGWSRLVLPVNLKSGANRVTFAIDPYQKTIESDEKNNTFWINVVVNQPFPSAGPK